MKRVRVGIVGSGFGATVHLPGWRRVAGAEVVGIASARRERAETIARDAAIPFATDDYRALLDRVDLLSIAAPPEWHHPMVLAAAEAGKHVYCEKPFATSVAEARAMLAAVERAGVVHAIGHEFRFLPGRALATELVAAGYVGEPFLVRVVDLTGYLRTEPRSPWWYSRAQRGGILQAIGSHYLDALRGWAGDLAAVSAALDTRVRHEPDLPYTLPADVSAEDTVGALVRFASGAQGLLQLSALAGVAQRTITIVGTAGTLEIDDDLAVRGAPNGAALAPLEMPAHLWLAFDGGPRLLPAFVRLAERVLARVRGEDAGAFPTFADALHVQLAMEAVYAAAESGRWEPIPAP